PFTLSGATTRTGLLTTPLRDRFGLTFRLDLYDPVELAAIVRRSAHILGVEVGDDAAALVGARSRGPPRAAAPGAHAADREPHPAPCARRGGSPARRRGDHCDRRGSALAAR